MIQIGSFAPVGEGYTGHLQTLTIDAEIDIVPINSDAEKAPDFSVQHNTREIGVAWRRTSKKGSPFIAVSLSDPSLIGPLRAVLFPPTEGAKHATWRLVWDRSAKTA